MKPHVFHGSDPIISGRNQVALCGETIKRVRWLWWTSDSTVWDIGQLPLGTCRKCLMVDIDQRYVYVGVAGKESGEE